MHSVTNGVGKRHRVVVVGGGFGGLNVARALDGVDLDLTVVDRTNHHLFQPLLYQVAAGILPPGLIAPALRGVLTKQRNVRVILADVHDIALNSRIVRTASPTAAVSSCPTTRWSSQPGPPTPTSASPSSLSTRRE
jgi:NADH dehydrogenase FAD-containing subunit